MTTTELIFELLKYTVPAALVLGAVWMVQKETRQRTDLKERYQLLKGTMDTVMPLRLQAYERAILFLERISPQNLIIRCDGNGKSARGFLTQMTMEIRAEYEHNLSQQLYIKPESWQALLQAKEEILTLFNQTARALPPEASGIDLGKTILAALMKSELAPSQAAILVLKKDVQQMFRF